MQVSKQAQPPVDDAAPTRSDLVSLIRGHADRSPATTALRFLREREDDSLALSYGLLDSKARAIAVILQARDAAGERALILHPPGPGYVCALLGCFYAGVIAVPAYPPRMNRTLDRLRDIAIDSGARFALTTSGILGKIAAQPAADPALAALSWIGTDQIDEAFSDSWMPPQIMPDSTAFLQYTSGSTSTPKGVVLSHANLLSNVDAMVTAMRLGAADHVVSWLPPYHDMGLIGTILLPLCFGIEATLLTPAAFLQRPFRWLSAISRYRGTIAGAPNFAYEMCARRITAEQAATLDLAAWRVAFCGAERVRPGTVERFTRIFAAAGLRHTAFTPCYGLAEATLAVTYGSIDHPPTVREVDGVELVSCGSPVAGCSLVIVDPDSREPRAAGSIGEIWVKSPGVAQGYWGRPEASEPTFAAVTAAAHAATYLRTGDLGCILEGELYVAGRIKDLIILRGLNYYPEDIEGAVADCHPRLRTGGGAAFCVDVDGEERLVVAHEVDSIRDVPFAQMIRCLTSQIAETLELQVHDVILLPPGGLPKTSSGKVQRRRCRDLYLSAGLSALTGLPDAGIAHAAAAPAALAQAVADLMADVLGMQAVATSDDFFWLGGHSLMATQLVSRLRETFAVELPLRSIFEAKTPQAIASLLAASARMPALPPIEAADRREPLALSFSQERMWYMHRLDPAGSAYNVAGAALLEGALDPQALQRAFALVIDRHEVLRSNYRTIDGVPEVVVAPALEVPFEITDLRGSPDAFLAARTAASALASAPFDIAVEPLIRIALYRLDAEQCMLAISMHHLITDAWSLGMLVTDVLRFYDALIDGIHPPEPAGPQLAYVDYARWQRCFFTDEYLRAQGDYWRAQLHGAAPVELPTDRRRTQRLSSAGAHIEMSVTQEMFEALNALAVSRGSTLFMVMLAAFEVLLYRYTGRADLVVGIPVANRNFRAAESLMGSLVNTLPLRLRFDEDITFDALLDGVRDAALDAYANQDMPFERLVSQLAMERKRGESPLLSVMFDFQNAPMPGRTDRAPRLSPVMLSRGAAQFDLSLLMMDTGLGRTVGFEYATELFDAATIERMIEHFHSILASIIERPQEMISKLPLLTRTQRETLFAAASAGDTAGSFEPLPARIARQAERHPAACAVRDIHGSMTYEQLDRSADRLAAELQSFGVAPGERVAVYLPRDRQLIIALLAVLKTGAAYVPLDPNYPPERVCFVLADSAPRVLVTERRLLAALQDSAGLACICIDDASRPPPARPLARVDCAEVAAAYVLYTSGSTGRPKGVEVSQGGLGNFLDSMRHTPGICAQDILLSVTTIAFDIAGLELWLPLSSGASVCLADAAAVGDPSRLIALMHEVRPTLMQATPSTWQMLIDANWAGDPALRILCGGEAMSVELARSLLCRADAVWNLYGPTETTIWSTVHRVTAGDGVPIPVGVPIDRTQVYILDRHREPSPTGIPGEMYIGGAGVATGYFNRPDLTAERFVPDPFSTRPGARLYRTGDAGRIRSDGLIECLGRLDNQIKLRGFRIEPGEIEAVLKRQDGINEALVIAHADRSGHRSLIAYLVAADPGHLPPSAELQEQLRRSLPAYMIPAAFVALQAFPKTPNGKIDRNALPAPDFAAAVAEDRVAPRDDVERTVAAIWSEVLGRPDLGIRDSFFQLGGHSLLAVKVFSRMEKRFGVALPLAILHERPTVEYLAEAIRVRLTAPATASDTRLPDIAGYSFLVPIQTLGSRPRLFCVHGAGGNVVNLSSIARHLGTDQPFMGLQAQGTDGRRKPLTSIEAMAECYLQELRELQPHGPYRLSGYCGGGIVAFEMAARLRSAGETVDMLLLIDCYRPGPVREEPRLRRWRREWASGGLRYVAEAARAKFRRHWTAARDVANIGLNRLRGNAVPYELRDAWLTAAFLRAAARYRPGIYPGRLTLLRAIERDAALRDVGADMGWRGLVTGAIETLDVPGDHHSIMEEPNVAVLAATVNRCLEASAYTRLG